MSETSVKGRDYTLSTQLEVDVLSQPEVMNSSRPLALRTVEHHSVRALDDGVL